MSFQIIATAKRGKIMNASELNAINGAIRAKRTGITRPIVSVSSRPVKLKMKGYKSKKVKRMPVEILKGGKAISQAIKQIGILAGAPVPSFACPQCAKSFTSDKGLQDHTKAKHAPIKENLTVKLSELQAMDQANKEALSRIPVKCPDCGMSIAAKNLKKHKKQHASKAALLKLRSEAQIHSAVVVEGMRKEDQERKALASLKASIHEELTAPEKPYFNVEAFSHALRTLTKPEAIRIAKNQEEAEAYLNALRSPTASAEEKSNVVSPKAVEAVTEAPVSSQRDAQIRATIVKGSTRSTTSEQRDSGEQAEFKKRVLNNFSGKCAITGLALPVVQACHVESFSINHDHSTDNGIALEPTLHALFDKGLLGIHPTALTVHFAIDCFYKELFEGKEIKSMVKLSSEKLAKKWESYKGNK